MHFAYCLQASSLSPNPRCILPESSDFKAYVTQCPGEKGDGNYCMLARYTATQDCA